MKLLSFLKGLEVALPPGVGRHHAITYGQYGNDDAGWDDRLCLHVWAGDVSVTLFLDDADLAKTDDDLIGDVENHVVEALAAQPQANA